LPIYTYECQSCGSTLEKRQSFSDAPLTNHEACGGTLRRVIHPAGIVFKGSGFYNTDYKNGSSAKRSETADGTSDTASSDASKSENGSTASASSSDSGKSGDGAKDTSSSSASSTKSASSSSTPAPTTT
jgi:putative FmdB family regulatory protein